jgi:hypothetical protein
LDEIEDIVSIQRSGRLPCPHLHDPVSRKRADLGVVPPAVEIG